MLNLTRKICDYLGYDKGRPDVDRNPTPNITPADIPRQDKVSAKLKDHVTMTHELPLRLAVSRANCNVGKGGTNRFQLFSQRGV